MLSRIRSISKSGSGDEVELTIDFDNDNRWELERPLTMTPADLASPSTVRAKARQLADREEHQVNLETLTQSYCEVAVPFLKAHFPSLWDGMKPCDECAGTGWRVGHNDCPSCGTLGVILQ